MQVVMEAAMATDAICVCPTSVDLGVQYYWRNPRNEEALMLLIRALSQQFPIDPDRICLSGYSMGGMGTYFLGARLTERFAAIAPGGGAWSGIFWAGMLNTPVYIFHGKNDLRGKQFTDFPNAENAAEYLKQYGCPCEFRAVDSDHFKMPPVEHKKAFAWLLTKKRDPYPKRIVFASPRAKDFIGTPAQARPDRWLTIDSIGDQQLEMDGVEYGGTPKKKHTLKMGTLDATWSAPNTLEVKAQNVRAFRVFISPNLVDLKKPLKIVSGGKPVYDGAVPTSCKFLIKYADEHRDPGMMFIGEVVVDLSGTGGQ
jgi:hypothetical protein